MGVEAKAQKKPYNDDFLQFCIHLTASSGQYTPVLRRWIIADEINVSQSKAFFISFASPCLSVMQLEGKHEKKL